MKGKFMNIDFGKFMKLFTTVFVFTVILLSAVNVQGQRQQFTQKELEQIQRRINCSDCPTVKESLVSAATLTGDVAQFVGQQIVDSYYEKGLAWISKSAIVGTIGGIAVGLIQPSALAPPSMDMRPNNRQLQVTCRDQNGREVPCPRRP